MNQSVITYFLEEGKKGTASSISTEYHQGLKETKTQVQFFQQKGEFPHFDHTISVEWLNKAHLRYETKSCWCVTQEQALTTGYLRACIWGDGSSGFCHFCDVENKTVDHIFSWCKMFYIRMYFRIQDLICTYLHWAVRKDL